MTLLPITREKQADGAQAPGERLAADSVLRVWIVPDQTWKIALDYDLEQVFRSIVFKTFPSESFDEDLHWTSSEQMTRDSSFVRIDYAHVDRDLQSKWVFTSHGEFGYATVLSEVFPPGGPLWSLSDLAVQLVAAIRSAHALLANSGYLGEARVHVSADPAKGELFVERNALPFIRFCSGRPATPPVSWREIVPQPPVMAASRSALSIAPCNFHSRSETIHLLVADLLNQLLRDWGYGAVLSKLRQYAAAIAS